jgi:DNA-binding NarL/FixJ family response regulator
MAIRVMLVDDQVLLRTGFRMVLAAQPDMEVVAEAGDGGEAIEVLRHTRVDVVLMDVRMPRMDGVEATRQICNGDRGDTGRHDAGSQDLSGPGTGRLDPTHPDPTRRSANAVPRVLILTTFDLDEYAFAALKAGASGFMLKDVPPDELLTAIRAVHSGDAVVAPSTTRRLLDRFTPMLPASGAAGEQHKEIGKLTDREREVLLLVAQGLSNGEIARKLVLSEATVKTHVGRILTKLDLRDRVQAVVLAYESGLVRAGGGAS